MTTSSHNLSSERVLQRSLSGRLWRSWLALFLICTISVLLSIRYVDRPLAEFCNRHVVGSRPAAVVFFLLSVLRPLVLVAFVFMLACGMRVLSGGGLSRASRRLAVCSVALVLAIGAEFILKQIFGRGDIVPTYVVHHVYRFDFLHSRDGFWSFPSGTALGLFAVVGVLYVWDSRLKVMAVVLSGLTCAAVTLLNYHWASDTIAGAFIGLTIGYATACLFASYAGVEEASRIP